MSPDFLTMHCGHLALSLEDGQVYGHIHYSVPVRIHYTEESMSCEGVGTLLAPLPEDARIVSSRFCLKRRSLLRVTHGRSSAILVAAGLAVVLSLLLYGAVLALPPAAGSAPGARPAAADVTIGDFFFSQSVITVPVGSTVQWTNIGGFAHTTSSTDALWDSGALGSNDIFTHTMAIPGSFGYICSIHPSMQGTVVVTGTFPNTLFLPTLSRE